jgi:type II secretory pathway component GspD/PulD (secretin)
MDHEIVYGPIPDMGDPITMPGPMPVSEFLTIMHDSTYWNIIPTAAAQAIVLNFWLIEATPDQALKVLKAHDVYYEFEEENNFLYVMTVEEYLEKTYADQVSHEFEVQHTDPEYIQSILKSLKSAKGRIVTDQRIGHFYVWDTKDNLDQMIKTVEELDVPLTKKEFSVQYVDLQNLETVLNAMLSPIGRLLVDGRTAQVYVWDSPVALELMAHAVKELDVPEETQVFPIVHISAEELTDSLEELLSERGILQVDVRSNTLIITDLPPRLERIAKRIKTFDQKLDTRTWVINYADIDFIADQIALYVPMEMGEIVVNDPVHQITVTGLPQRLNEIDELIAVWDIKRRQVQIQAYIVDMNNDVARHFGINWSYFGESGNVPITVQGGSGFDTTGSAPARIGQLPFPIFRERTTGYSVDGSGNQVAETEFIPNIAATPANILKGYGGADLAVSLDYLNQQGKATILASPQITVQEGEPALFKNATQVPYTEQTTSFFNASLNSNRTTNSNRIAFVDVGIILDVLPRITKDDNVLLEVSAEDSSFVEKELVTNDQTSTIPQTTKRSISTQVRAQSGATIVLGGLRTDESTESVTRTPLLGDLPLLGRIFRHPNKSSSHQTMLIFITPTIVDEFSHPEASILARVEDKLATDYRHNKKNLWGRMGDKMSRGKNELNVSVGESGSIHSNGEMSTMAELDELLASNDLPKGVTVVIRHHHKAPAGVVTAITDAAMRADRKIEFDRDFAAFVPTNSETE